MANSTGFDRTILDAAGLRLDGGGAIADVSTASGTFEPGGMPALIQEEQNLDDDHGSDHHEDAAGDVAGAPEALLSADKPASQNGTDKAENSEVDGSTALEAGGSGPTGWIPREAASIEVTSEPVSSEEELILATGTVDPDSTTKTKQSADSDGPLLAKTSALSSGGTTTLVVTSASDEAVGASLVDDLADGGGLSLREAINWNVAGDTIGFDAALSGQTLTLTGGELALTQDICIHGDIDGDGKADITLSGGNSSRIFNVSGSGTDADLVSLTLTNGSATSGGAILTNSGTTLNLINSTLQNSSATHGAGLFNDGALTIVNSSITGNAASAYGGGLNIGINQSATLINTTIYGNTADNDGGGIYAREFSVLDIHNSSITSNTAGFVGGGIALFESSTATITNSVIALNDGFGGAIADDVSATGAYTTLNADSSFFGNTVTIDSGANNTNNGGDPLLGQLLDNGGTVMTRSPLDGSLLIGAGDTALLPLDTFDLDDDGLTLEDLPLDARNEARTNGVMDIGAVEQIADEIITGTAGNDFLVGGTGDDLLNGGAGDDTLDGGADIDTASYLTSTGAVTVGLNLQGAAQNTGTASGLDTLVDIENIIGSTFADTLTGNSQNNTLSGNAGDDTLSGSGGNDSLDGGAGADTLNGGTGADTMTGGADDDSYFVDNAGDVIIELGGGGTADVVRSTLSYTLGGNVEQLRLLGSANIDATGNSEDNLLVGNSGNNRLNGSTGADTMQGGDGDDIYTVDNAGDVVIEGSNLGSDRVNTSISLTLGSNIEDGLLLTSANLNLTGNAFGNFLIGNAGNNILDGGAGVDTLAGKAGDDTYIVDLPTDFISEQAAEGTDTVQSTVNYSLRPNIENLTLLGTYNLQGIGNAENNILIGNVAANRLNGSTGADTMMGGDGNDLYSVDDAGDIIIENANEGIDTVLSFASQTLGANVERLYLFGTADINAIGNSENNGLLGNDGNNILSGNAGNDLLFGGLGNDTMTGGTGFDTFFFRTALDGVNNVDTLIDFSHADDTMRLDDAVFSGLSTGLLSANAFIIGTAAGDADDRIIYDDTTGDLFYDADGNGAGAQVQFATLDDIPTDVVANDFLVF